MTTKNYSINTEIFMERKKMNRNTKFHWVKFQVFAGVVMWSAAVILQHFSHGSNAKNVNIFLMLAYLSVCRCRFIYWVACTSVRTSPANNTMSICMCEFSQANFILFASIYAPMVMPFVNACVRSLYQCHLIN